MSVDLSSRYLGLELSNPLLVSSCPLTGELGSLCALERAGAAAVVLPSLFQEQIEHEELELVRLEQFGAESFAEATSYRPEFVHYNAGPEGYLRLVEAAREALRIPVIASLNGVSPEGWARYARRIEAAGAHAIELNLLVVPTDPRVSAEAVEALWAAQVTAVRAAVRVPLAVKLGPQLTAPLHVAARLKAAGASGIVLFNRTLDPDIDLETLAVVPRLELSQNSELRAVLRWTALLSAHGSLSIAASSGVQSANDVVKLVLAGADAVGLAAALLRHGPELLTTLRTGLAGWLQAHGYESAEQARGSMNHAHCPDPSGYERTNYMRALLSFS